MEKYEDKIYSLGEAVTGQTQAMSQAVQKTLENNGGVGIMTGSYDQNLSILSVNNLLLHSTGYTFDTFMEQTKGSLRNFFYDEEDTLERDRFLRLHGTWEAQILTADGTVKNVRLCKEDATDEADYLVNHGVPFRDAHGIVGQLVLYCIDKNIALDDMSLEEYKAISPVFEEDIYEAISMKTCVEMRNTIGAPGKSAMEQAIALEEAYLKEE